MSLGQGVVIVVAGAAADYVSPDVVIAICGAVGAMVAAALAAAWARERRQIVGSHRRR
jgi:hypothetical protein